MVTSKTSAGSEAAPGWLSESIARMATTMSPMPSAMRPETGSSPSRKNVIPKTKSATGTRKAAAPKDRVRKSCTALVTTAFDSKTSAARSATAMTAITIPRMSPLTVPATGTLAGARRAEELERDLFAARPFAAFEVRLAGI